MKTFKYIFADGAEYELPSLTSAELYELKDMHGELIFNGFRDQIESLQLLRANSHSRGDGFKPGWHPGLNMEIRSNEHYQSVLKEKGMVEIGNEKRKKDYQYKSTVAETVVEEAKKAGVKLSDRETDKLLGKTE